MTGRNVIPRQTVERDIEHVISHHFDEGGADLAMRFIDELETAFRHLSNHAETGSPRYASELDLPGLRHWSLRQFPYLIFYVMDDDIVDVWRVLHGRRDIPEAMQLE